MYLSLIIVLLAIIAIGVLLMSELGQKFLIGLLMLGLLAVVCYLGYWLIIILIGFVIQIFTADDVAFASTVNVVGTIGGIIGYGIFGFIIFLILFIKYREGKLKLPSIRKK